LAFHENLSISARKTPVEAIIVRINTTISMTLSGRV
jgi:hypothetical protein